MKIILMIVLLLNGSAFSAVEESSTSSDSTETGLFRMIMELTGREERSWARPIERMDMDKILELMETGLITFHRADWYVIVDDE